METTVQTGNSLDTISVQDFMIENNFVSLAREVRENTNGYPFVTFINADNEAENVYFSKNGASRVAKGEVIEKGFFDPFEIAKVENAEGEERTKLVTGGEGRVSMESLFG